MVRHSKAVAFLCVLVSPFVVAGTWTLSGKGSHAAAGGSNVTYDTSATSGVIESDNQYTVAITVASNSNRLLVVTIGTADVTDANEQVTSVSSNLSGAFTQKTEVDNGTWSHEEIWYLVNPATGAHTITVTLAGSPLQSATHAVSLYGVDQSTPTGTAATSGSGSVTSTAPTASVTLGSDDMAVGGLMTDSEGTLSFTTGTSRQVTLNISSDTAQGTATNTGTGSVAITASTSDAFYSMVVVPINGAP